jgi:hypothetical protein
MSDVAEVIDLSPRRHAEDLRQTWQGRMLYFTRMDAAPHAIVLSMLANYFETDAVLVLLKAVFPGFDGIKAPFICSAAKINKAGQVVADFVDRNELVHKDYVIFRNTVEMKSRLRKLADAMKLTDRERIEFFTVARRWVVADRRLDPSMDPQDPDAKRLVYH